MLYKSLRIHESLRFMNLSNRESDSLNHSEDLLRFMNLNQIYPTLLTMVTSTNYVTMVTYPAVVTINQRKPSSLHQWVQAGLDRQRLLCQRRRYWMNTTVSNLLKWFFTFDLKRNYFAFDTVCVKSVQFAQRTVKFRNRVSPNSRIRGTVYLGDRLYKRFLGYIVRFYLFIDFVANIRHINETVGDCFRHEI